jgi:hypothetical protein
MFQRLGGRDLRVAEIVPVLLTDGRMLTAVSHGRVARI